MDCNRSNLLQPFFAQMAVDAIGTYQFCQSFLIGRLTTGYANLTGVTGGNRTSAFDDKSKISGRPNISRVRFVIKRPFESSQQITCSRIKFSSGSVKTFNMNVKIAVILFAVVTLFQPSHCKYIFNRNHIPRRMCHFWF